MAKDKKTDDTRTPRVGDWVTYWYPEAKGLRALPAQILGPSRLGGYDVNLVRPGAGYRLVTGCQFSDSPKGRFVAWEAPTVSEGFITAPEPQPELEPAGAVATPARQRVPEAVVFPD